LSVSAISNIFLDLLFVIVFDWGVAAAAFATVIAQTLCAIVSYVYW
jgi:Na+-driven multidrug efflux pump